MQNRRRHHDRVEEHLFTLIQQGQKIMSDMTKLNAALTDLQTEVGDIGNKMDALIKALNDAHSSGDQAAIDVAAAAIEEQVAALKAIGERDTPPAPAPTP
jgi:uncharacterized coiled-coil protein SlyX